MVTIAWVSIGVAFLCAAFILLDEAKHPQSMQVMNIVWPLTALYCSVFAVWAYLTTGRRYTRKAQQSGSHHPQHDGPTAAQVAVGTSHCGAGCMLADIVAEFAVAAAGLVLLGSVLWTSYIVDFIAAWLLGIVFQYFAIKPMRDDLTRGGAIAAAIKADTLSILAFQIGMYAWMALVYFKLFTAPHLTAFDPRYWLMMQIGMICGFATSFPMNRLLIGIGWKEAM
ncbi:MAG TPA: DUF4396 domain-containing protein [Candidatus Aquilonibacter sp.]|nr:DUF4396 domain-containing protein [Candidatus Aquilonibacter sp.]